MRHAVLACLLVLGGGVVAQNPAGSQSYVALAQDVVAGGGVATSPSFVAESGVGPLATGHRATSSSYALEAGVVWAGTALAAGGPPVIFQVTPRLGDLAGGETRTVVGLGLDNTTISFGGVPTPQPPTMLSSTAWSVTTPPGIAPPVVGNPLGATAVSAVGIMGAATLENGFVYTPALTLERAAVRGTTATFRLTFAPLPQMTGALYSIAFGMRAPGLSINPVSGLFELALGTFETFIWPPATAQVNFTSQPTVDFDIPIPPSLAPGLAGSFQAVVWNPLPPAGQFTNVLTVTIL